MDPHVWTFSCCDNYEPGAYLDNSEADSEEEDDNITY